jgi:hypothetical protein
MQAGGIQWVLFILWILFAHFANAQIFGNQHQAGVCVPALRKYSEEIHKEVYKVGFFLFEGLMQRTLSSIPPLQIT